MRRRDFLGVAGGALLVGPTTALAQRVYRVVVLTPSQSQWQPRTFRDALHGIGYREGANLKIEVVSAENELGRLPKLAEEIATSSPDVIVAVNTPGTRAAMSATTTISIVSAVVADPVFLGIVSNIARPGGNVTGVANMGANITSKRIALLKEIAPSARRIALFMHPDEPISELQIQDVGRSSAALDIECKAFPMRTLADLQQGFEQAIQWKSQAIVRLAGQGFALGAETGSLATQNSLPSMLLQRRDVEAGGLMSYFADHQELWRRIAAQVDRILRGTPPRDLPFELPVRFELTINLKACKSLGLTVPTSLIAQADEVIE